MPTLLEDIRPRSIPKAPHRKEKNGILSAVMFARAIPAPSLESIMLSTLNSLPRDICPALGLREIIAQCRAFVPTSCMMLAISRKAMRG